MSLKNREAEDAETVSVEALVEAEKKLSEAEALNNELRENRDALFSGASGDKKLQGMAADNGIPPDTLQGPGGVQKRLGFF